MLGLQQLIRTISMVKKRLNKKLRIGGIVLTMVDKRTNYAKDIMESVRKNYEGILLFYGSTIIPFKDKFDKTLKLYSLMTTKPEEVEARKQKEMEE